MPLFGTFLLISHTYYHRCFQTDSTWSGTKHLLNVKIQIIIFFCDLAGFGLTPVDYIKRYLTILYVYHMYRVYVYKFGYGPYLKIVNFFLLFPLPPSKVIPFHEKKILVKFHPLAAKKGIGSQSPSLWEITPKWEFFNWWWARGWSWSSLSLNYHSFF